MGLAQGKSRKKMKVFLKQHLREVIEETGIKNLSIIKAIRKNLSYISKGVTNHYSQNLHIGLKCIQTYKGKFKPQTE